MSELKGILRNWYVGQKRYGRKYGQLGKIVSSNRIYEAGNGKTWITYDDGTTDAVISNEVRKPLHVIVEPNDDGVMEVIGLQIAKTLASTGYDAESLATLNGRGRHRHYIGSGNEDSVESRRFEPGLLHAFSGLTVYIEPFAYDYNGTEARWLGGSINLTSNRPATTSYWAWVKVGIDPATNTAVATTGTEKVSRSLLTSTELDAINFDTSGYIPCGGVILQQGQTASPIETDFMEARDFITKFDPARPPAIGGTTPAAITGTDITANRYALTASTTLTIAAGVVTATKGYHLIDAESGATDDLDTINGMLTRSYLIIQAASGDTITVKNGTGNIFLNGGADFSLTGDKTLLLYNDGTNISDVGAGGSGSASPWQTTSNVANLVTSTDTVTIGSATALAKLAVDGDADEIQLLVQANATQTSLLAVFEDSAGNDQVTISGDGAAVFNEEGNDADFRVESDGDANNLFSDGGQNSIGVGTNSPAASAKLDISSTTKAFLPPRMTTTQRDAIATPSNGLQIYNSTTHNSDHYIDGAWRPLARASLANLASVAVNTSIISDTDVTDDLGSASIRWLNVYAKNHVGNVHVTPVKNTSGSTANANHVGYITYTAGSGAEYKTTTTANLNAAWCVVVEGGANNADIYVATSGIVTVELNANCSAGDFLTTSTTAGRAAVNTLMRPEVFAVAQTANAGGAGGTCTARLYCGTSTIAAVGTTEVYRVTASSVTDFVATINGAPSATSVVYNAPSAGNENTIVPTASNHLGKARMWNTTRGTSRLITAVNTGTNTITTVSSTDAWASGDTITIESQTVTTALSYKFVDVDLSQTTEIPVMARSMSIQLMVLDSATATGSNAGLYPYQAWGSIVLAHSSLVLNSFTTVVYPLPIISRVITTSQQTVGGAGAGDRILRLVSYNEAVP